MSKTIRRIRAALCEIMKTRTDSGESKRRPPETFPVCPQCGATNLIAIEGGSAHQGSFKTIPKHTGVTSQNEGEVTPLVDRGSGGDGTAALPEGMCLIRSKTREIIAPVGWGNVPQANCARSQHAWCSTPETYDESEQTERQLDTNTGRISSRLHPTPLAAKDTRIYARADVRADVRTDVRADVRADGDDARAWLDHNTTEEERRETYVMEAPSLDRLPTEILLRICSHLPKDGTFAGFSATCRRMHHVTNDSTLWLGTTLRIHDGLRYRIIHRTLNASARSLTTLDVSDCLSVTDEFLRYVALVCPALRDIDIARCVLVSDEGLDYLAATLATLTSVSVAGTRLVTSEGIGRILRLHQRSMQRLDISRCLGLERNSYRLSYLPDYCVNLTDLRIEWQRDFLNIIPLWEMRIAQFAAFCPNLTRLDVSGSPVRDFREATDAIATHCNRLRRLDMAQSGVSDAGLVKIAVKLTLLEHLDVSHSGEVSDVGIHSLCLGLTTLRHLDISRCRRVTDDAVLFVLRTLVSLRHFLLRGCYRVTGEAFTQLTSLYQGLCLVDVSGTVVTSGPLERLEQLAGDNVAFTVITDDCPFVVGGQSLGPWPEIPQSITQQDDYWVGFDIEPEM